MNVRKALQLHELAKIESEFADLSEILARIDEGQVLVVIGGWRMFFEGQKCIITTAQKYAIRRLVKQRTLQFVWTGVKWTIQRAPVKAVQA